MGERLNFGLTTHPPKAQNLDACPVTQWGRALGLAPILLWRRRYVSPGKTHTDVSTKAKRGVVQKSIPKEKRQ